jgi:hypothetical protein
MVQQHAVSVITHTEDSTTGRLLCFSEVDFDAFLEFGILALAFLRLRFGECRHNRPSDFSVRYPSPRVTLNKGSLPKRCLCPQTNARTHGRTVAACRVGTTAGQAVAIFDMRAGAIMKPVRAVRAAAD